MKSLIWGSGESSPASPRIQDFQSQSASTFDCPGLDFFHVWCCIFALRQYFLERTKNLSRNWRDLSIFGVFGTGESSGCYWGPMECPSEDFQFFRYSIRTKNNSTPDISKKIYLKKRSFLRHVISLKFMWFKYELLTPSDKKDTAFGSCGRISLQGVSAKTLWKLTKLVVGNNSRFRYFTKEQTWNWLQNSKIQISLLVASYDQIPLELICIYLCSQTSPNLKVQL